MADWRDDRVGSAGRGENPLVMARMRSGFAVIGDTQHLPGYSLLLTDDPAANHLTDLDWERRKEFLFDLSLLGEAVQRACRENGLRRINYEVLGNSSTVLHGHVHARYDWEPPERIGGPVWRYPKAERNDPRFAYTDAQHGTLRAAITAEIQGLVAASEPPFAGDGRLPAGRSGCGKHPFQDVDAQSDPGAWIGVLDRLRREPVYAAYKGRVAELVDARPGGRYLELGCGTGADALELAQRAGCAVVGVDASHTMITEAGRRGLTHAVVADAHRLPFAADTFDGAWADRTFQHIGDPAAALAELVRVVRPGGSIVVADPDYATQVVNVPDQELAQRVLAFRAGVGHWQLAHQMPRLCAEAGLSDIRVEAVPIVLQDPAALDNALGLRDWACLAHEQRLLRSADVAAWESAIDKAAGGGWFLYSFSVFITTARKPGSP